MTFSKENINNRYRELKNKFRNFLHSPQCREFLFFLFFVFIASTFWVLQTLNENYETEVSVPLRIKNVPDNVIVTTPPPSQLNLSLQDKGTVLVNYMLGKGFVPITLDFNEYATKSNHIRLLTSELEKKILSQLAISTKLNSIYPDTLEIIYTQEKGKKVPVKIDGSTMPEKQYYIAGRNVRPDSVMVYAPKGILDTITSVYTEQMRAEHITDTLRQTIRLQSLKGVKLIPEQVEVNVFADLLTEKTVAIPIVGIDFPADKQLKTFPAKVNVTFQVGRNLFKHINAEDFSIEVSYNNLSASGKCDLRLTTSPAGISHARISPETVEYLIEQNY